MKCAKPCVYLVYIIFEEIEEMIINRFYGQTDP